MVQEIDSKPELMLIIIRSWSWGTEDEDRINLGWFGCAAKWTCCYRGLGSLVRKGKAYWQTWVLSQVIGWCKLFVWRETKQWLSRLIFHRCMLKMKYQIVPKLSYSRSSHVHYSITQNRSYRVQWPRMLRDTFSQSFKAADCSCSIAIPNFIFSCSNARAFVLY